jgi:hypothetical protein
MKIIQVPLLIACLFIFGNADSQEKFRLEYKFIKGKTYRYQENSNSQTVHEINGEEMKGTVNTTALMKMVVENISETGDITIINSLEDYTVKSKMFMRDTTLVMKDLLNREIRTVISHKGVMVDNKLVDTSDTVKDITDKKNSLINIYKEFTRLPDEEVKIGDTWRDDRTDTTEGTQMVTRTERVFTLLGVEEKSGHTCFKAGFSGKTEISGKMNQMGMEFFMEGSGEITGTAWFDKETCIIILKETTSDQDMTMAMTGQMQMTIPITSSTNTKIVLQE